MSRRTHHPFSGLFRRFHLLHSHATFRRAHHYSRPITALHLLPLTQPSLQLNPTTTVSTNSLTAQQPASPSVQRFTTIPFLPFSHLHPSHAFTPFFFHHFHRCTTAVNPPSADTTSFFPVSQAASSHSSLPQPHLPLHSAICLLHHAQHHEPPSTTSFSTSVTTTAPSLFTFLPDLPTKNTSPTSLHLQHLSSFIPPPTLPNIHRAASLRLLSQRTTTAPPPTTTHNSHQPPLPSSLHCLNSNRRPSQIPPLPLSINYPSLQTHRHPADFPATASLHRSPTIQHTPGVFLRHANTTSNYTHPATKLFLLPPTSTVILNHRNLLTPPSSISPLYPSPPTSLSSTSPYSSPTKQLSHPFSLFSFPSIQHIQSTPQPPVN